MTDYDEVRYPCHTYEQTHPEHLYVLGRLHGMTPARPANCRVLEIGCGDGGNLVPMASQFPQSRFFGFDLAETSITAGQARAKDFALTNLELRHLDLMEFPESTERFDYIIVHGFYSWVPEAVRERMLELVRRILTPQGIAFVSYNAYPGSHIRGMIRDMMLFHVNRAPDARTKLQQAKAFLGFMEQGMTGTDEHGQLLKAEVARVQGYDPSHLFHDDLAAINQAFYLHEFAARAEARGLQYLTDTDYPSTQFSRLAPEVRELLEQMDNVVMREQYLDFLRCRRFRQSLLCHAEVTLERQPAPRSLREFWIAGMITATPGSTDEWSCPAGARLRSPHPVARAALTTIGARWPGRWDFSSLADAVEKETGGPREAVEDLLDKVLWEAFTSGLIHAWPDKESFAAKLSERPVASPLARRMLQHGNSVVTMLHGNVTIGDAAGRLLISLLDGTRDQAALVEALAASPVLIEQCAERGKRLEMARENVTSGLQHLLGLALLTA